MRDYKALIAAVAVILAIGGVSYFGYHYLKKTHPVAVKSTTSKVKAEVTNLWAKIPPYTKEAPMIEVSK